MHNTARDEREFTRTPVHLAVTVVARDGSGVKGLSRNLSMNGMFVDCAGRLPTGAPCRVILPLGGGAARVEVEGRIATHTVDGMGIAFDRVAPEDFEHLKRLVLYHAPDVERAEAEIAGHLGIKDRIQS
jgi:PilZ domain